MLNPSIQHVATDRQEILRALRAMYRKGDVVELRALNVTAPWGKPVQTASGYFTDAEALADAAVEVGATAKAIYTVLNQIDPALLGRSANKVSYGNVTATADSNITARRLMLIDADPKRPSGTSSSEKEHAASLTRIQEIRDYLTKLQWPEPIVADSGNGGHLLYRINLPADDKGLVKRVLEGLAVRFSDDLVQVDTSVYNPARISKLYGTVARKGDDLRGVEGVEDRPHRLSRIISAPETFLPVVIERLQAVALPVMETQKTQFKGGTPFDLEQWIEDHDLDVRAAKKTSTGTVWVLNRCPWNEASDDPHADDESAYIIQLTNGAIGAGCHHERCKEHNWSELREMYEPGYKEKRPENKPAEVRGAKPKVITLDELDQKDIPEPKWVIPGILPEGVSILAGKPKMGKSWLALEIALATAFGGQAMGKVQVAKGEVLYLGLEDSERRMQDRVRKLRNNRPNPKGFYVATHWNPLGQGGLADIEDHLKAHPNTRLVVVDTLAKVRPPSKTNANAYQEDYSVMSPIKDLSERYHVAILLIHHLRKMGAGDVMDEISGSTGLTGAADTMMVLKRDRGQVDGVLHITGRDVEEQELPLKFDPVSATWTLMDGTVREYQVSKERKEVIDVLLAAKKPMKPKEIADALNKTSVNVRKLLGNMKNAGEVIESYGTYIPSALFTDHSDHTSHGDHTDHSDHTLKDTPAGTPNKVENVISVIDAVGSRSQSKPACREDVEKNVIGVIAREQVPYTWDDDDFSDLEDHPF